MNRRKFLTLAAAAPLIPVLAKLPEIAAEPVKVLTWDSLGGNPLLDQLDWGHHVDSPRLVAALWRNGDFIQTKDLTEYSPGCFTAKFTEEWRQGDTITMASVRCTNPPGKLIPVYIGGIES